MPLGAQIHSYVKYQQQKAEMSWEYRSVNSISISHSITLHLRNVVHYMNDHCPYWLHSPGLQCSQGGGCGSGCAAPGCTVPAGWHASPSSDCLFQSEMTSFGYGMLGYLSQFKVQGIRIQQWVNIHWRHLLPGVPKGSDAASWSLHH